jgi:L-asparaginase
VLVVMNKTIFSARDVVKMNTTSLDTFEAPDRGPTGLVEAGAVTWFEPSDKKHTTSSDFSLEGVSALPRVDIIYAHSNMDDTLINAALRAGAKGIVIAGVGDGNMSKSALEALSQASKAGVVVVRSTRLPSGMVMRNAEVKDDEMGTVASGELNPGKSRVLLMMALTKPQHTPQMVQKLFNSY